MYFFNIILEIFYGQKTSWWAWQRKACNCESNKIAHDFTAISQGNGIAARSSSLLSMVLGAVFPPAVPITSFVAAAATLNSAYIGLLGSRINANNNGRGVVIHMTYALIFDIEPQ